MTIASKLLEINTTKGEIHDAIEAKGVSLTGVEFRDYATKIADISGGGGGGPSTAKDRAYQRPAHWPDAATWVTAANNRISIVYECRSDDLSNVMPVRCTTSSGTYSIDWGDGSSNTGIASNTAIAHTYSYASLTSLTATDGKKFPLIKITADSGNITQFTTTATATSTTGTRLPMMVEIDANCSSLSTFNIYDSNNAYPHYLRSIIVRAGSIANVGGNIWSNTVHGQIENIEITSSSTTIVGVNAMMSKRIVINNTATGALSIGGFAAAAEVLPTSNQYIELNLATNSNFSLANVCLFNGSLLEFKCTNSGTGKVTSLSGSFRNCKALEKITLPDLNSSCVVNQTFDRCAMIKEINADFTSITSGSSALVATFRSTTQAVMDAFTGVTATIWGSGGTAAFQQSSNIIKIPNLNFSTVTNWGGNGFEDCFGLAWVDATFNASTSISFTNCNLGATALNNIYTKLPTASGSRTITVSGNPGTSGDNPSIATAKGWTVTGS